MRPVCDYQQCGIEGQEVLREMQEGARQFDEQILQRLWTPTLGDILHDT
jgi:hypothetical protein